MSKQIHFEKLQLPITAIITAIILSLLLWQYFHEGVPSHNVLQNKDLPNISNWWGGLIIPALAWICLGRIKTRVTDQAVYFDNLNSNSKILCRFILGLVMSVMLAISFINGLSLFLDNVLYIFLILALMVPIFYSEFILGYVLGSAFTFGAVLPLAFVLIVSAIGYVLYRYIRPFLLKLMPSSES